MHSHCLLHAQAGTLGAVPVRQSQSTPAWRCKHHLTRGHLQVHAQAGPDSEPSSASREPSSSPQINPRTGRPSGLKLQRVERLGRESWAGVADVDRGSPQQAPLSYRAALLAGDVGMLLVFAAIGRRGHGEGVSPPELLSTAWPFITGWCIAAGVQGSYSSQPPASPAAAAGAAAKIWLAGIPAGIILRSASRGYIPDKSFVIVTLLATLVLLLGWRAAFSAVGPKGSLLVLYALSCKCNIPSHFKSMASTGTKQASKQGNPLEFFQLLSSLTRRW